MKSEFRLKLISAAVGLALGSAAAYAQPEQDRTQRSTSDSESALEGSRQQDSAREAERRQSQGLQSGSQDSQAASRAGQSGGSSDIDELAEQHEDLGRFVEALKATGLANSLTRGTRYTLFAPTDEAFESSEGQSLDELQRSENRQELTQLLRAHIVADQVDAEMARRIPRAETIDGGTVEISSQNDESIMVGEASVQGEPIELGNLTVYRIDGVLSSSAGASVASADAGAERRQAGRSSAERSSDSAPGSRTGAQDDRAGPGIAGNERDGRSREAGSDDAPFGQREGSEPSADSRRAVTRESGGQSRGASPSASGQYPDFEDVDRNSDGHISRAELAMVEGLDFMTADEDQNGELSRQEYRQAAEE